MAPASCGAADGATPWATSSTGGARWPRPNVAAAACFGPGPLDDTDAAELTRIAGSADHQGIVAEVEPYPYADPTTLLARPDALVVALDQVQDPHNLGAVCRSAESAGAAGVVIPARRSAAVTPAVAKASAGAVEHLPVARVRNLADWLAAARDVGAWIYGAAAEAPAALCRRRPDRPGRCRARQRGHRPAAAGGGELRPAGLDPGPGSGGIAERVGSSGRAPVRGGATALLAAVADGGPDLQRVLHRLAAGLTEHPRGA